MRNLKGAALACLLAVATVFPAAAAELGTQKSSDRGVTVAVTPKNVAAGAKTWDFTVLLDTHSGDLSDDLTKNAVLVDGRGTEYRPLAWEGAGPGGHHREGTLKFNPIAPAPAAIELRIQRQGEPSARSFRWQLK